MLSQTGVPTIEDLNRVFPKEERLQMGPVAIIECFQNIPCNPCATACTRNAIKPFKDINDLPNISHAECNGCSLCMSRCPGLAIMILDMTYSNTEVLMKLPYEFLPLPEPNEMVQGLDREGNYICDVRVEKVLNTKALDRTPIISIVVKKEFAKIIRNIRMED